MSGDRIDAYFVCAGKYHDMDFARLEILKLLADDDRIRTRVADSYADTAAIAASDFLITYTCDLLPSQAEQQALKAFLEAGGRWFALHGTNSIIRFLDNGLVGAPREAPLLMEMLGSQFIAHPPIGDFDVKVTDPGHALVADIEPFTTNDELYLSEFHGPCHTLLHTEWNGEATGFAEADWHADDPVRPVMYLHGYGAGEVLYLTLGHCRGRYDMQPLMETYPDIERCSWKSPVFYELLKRGIGWAHGRGTKTQ